MSSKGKQLPSFTRITRAPGLAKGGRFLCLTKLPMYYLDKG
jgi:hypothetical protein